MTIFLSVVLGLASMISYSLANVASQPIVRKLGSEQVIFFRGLVIVVALLLACVPFYGDLDSANAALATFALGVAGYIPVLAFMHGLRVSRVGIVAPISATSALFTVVLAFVLLDTPLSAVQWIAIGLVIAANVAISVNPKDLRNSNIMQLETGILYALIAAVGWGLFYFLLVYATRSLGPWLAALFVELGVTVAAGIHILAKKEAFKFQECSRSPILIVGGLLIVAGTVTYTIGVHAYNIGIVAVLSNSTALISAVLAAWLFKEKLSRFEKIIAAVMIAGVILVSIP